MSGVFIIGYILMSTQREKVLEFLKLQPLIKFKARDIAEGIITQYPEDYA